MNMEKSFSVNCVVVWILSKSLQIHFNVIIAAANTQLNKHEC